MRFRTVIIFFLILLPLTTEAQLKLMVTIDDKKILSELKALTEKKIIDSTDQKALITEKIKASFARDTLTACDSIRLNIVAKAFDYLGTKYIYGQSSEKGFDCSGYTMFIYRLFGIKLPHSSYGQFALCRHLKREEAKAGDLIFFTTRTQGTSHVGIYLGDNLFIHSPARGGSVCVGTIESGYFKRRLVGFGSLLE
jgi:cell wall-associated NlpC family hydrolase